MTALPPIADLTDNAATEAEAKTWFTNLRACLAGLLGADGAAATALATLGSLCSAVVAKSAAYTVATTDRGKLINCTGTWTLTLPAAATAGAGFAFAVRNTGSGTITVDGNSSETIDGETTLGIAAGVSAVVVCTGTAWVTVGRAVPVTYPIPVASGGTGATSASDAATNLSVVKRDHGHNNVGSLCFACPDNTGNTNDTINPGSTFAGSRLKPCATDEDQMYGTALSGTWRCLGYGKNVSNFGYGTLWQRIA